MWTRCLRPDLLLAVAGGIVALLALNVALAAQIPIGPGVTITPPQPMAAIEFVQEAGVERWQVKLPVGDPSKRCTCVSLGRRARIWVKSTGECLHLSTTT